MPPHRARDREARRVRAHGSNFLRILQKSEVRSVLVQALLPPHWKEGSMIEKMPDWLQIITLCAVWCGFILALGANIRLDEKDENEKRNQGDYYR